MAVILKGPWTRQPQHRVRGNAVHSVGVGLRALFDMRTGTELVTGNKASANTGTAQVSRGNICRDFSGTANVQFASNPNYVFTGAMTCLVYCDVDAFSEYTALIAKQTTAITQGFEFRVGIGPSDGGLTMVRANTGYKQYAGDAGVASLIATGPRQLLGFRSTSGAINTVPDILYNGRKIAGIDRGGSGTGAQTDSGSSVVWIGRRSDTATQLDGRIYWAALWNRALRDSEWLALWRNPWLIYDMVQMPVGSFDDATPPGGIAVPVAYRQRQMQGMAA